MDFDLELPFPPNCPLDDVIPFSQSFPTEILMAIFKLSCTDGRKTAVALSLVSKHFRSIAKPLLFYSITVRGVKQMRAIIDLFDRDPEIARAVRCLFLSQRTPSEFLSPIERSSMVDTLRRVVTPIAPSLETLCFFIPQDGDINYGDLYTIPFPNLREMTVDGFHKIEFPIPFPSLKRLHAYTSDLYDLLRDLVQKCPRLTHFKATGFLGQGDMLFHAFRQAWGSTPLYDDEVEWRKEFGPMNLPPLRRIILQPGIPTGRMCGFAWGKRSRMLGKLVWLAKKESKRGLIVEVPIPRGIFNSQAKKDWIDRLDGGRGCWEAKEQMRFAKEDSDDDEND